MSDENKTADGPDAASLIFGVIIGGVLGGCLSGYTSDVWKEWAITNKYAYRDPESGLCIYEPSTVREFWERNEAVEPRDE